MKCGHIFRNENGWFIIVIWAKLGYVLKELGDMN